ncbi:uncharacterized protein SPPG_02983 [Spizellomyces punctatus DAOM BR117]|uniref:Uncharacterized protein n=1 Tax=Spizellomyces punctatus (strain DAOM BR117) TaxID=645134 RepID=A0A0L0HNX4_SPIPD|nr:uncharacterized protein SPPG_02983 [Spizellomyces punctatus DAOM BR117]KND02524.1 hypothetical protein SPPG_02983 [Spizellomyces punctatus DAOM BR117]|eukprot:XP_016610563.1 hypothetical protein SPPG_02983 [Spizellomyces punctatus DAOM BR117]
MSRPAPQHPYAAFKRKAPVHTPSIPPASSKSAKGGPPTAADIVSSYARIPPRTKLKLSLGLLGFASLGVYMTYKFEEWYPLEKRAPTVAPDAKSRVDVLWEEEERKLEKLQSQRKPSQN